MKRYIKSLALSGAVFGIFLFGSNLKPVNAQTKTVYMNENSTNSSYITDQTNNQRVSNKGITTYKFNNGQPDYNQPVQIPANSTFTLSNYFNNGNLLNLKNTNDFYYLPPQADVNSFTYNNNSINLNKGNYKKLVNNANEWKNGLSKKEAKAVGYYTENGYTNINTYLRSPDSALDPKNLKNNGIKKKDLINSTNDVRNSVGRFNLTQPMTVYRGTSEDGLTKSLGNQPLEVGNVYNDAAFSSTSVDQNSANSFNNKVLLKINVPAGYHGAYIAPAATIKSEKEYLLNPSTKMVVSGIQNVDTTSNTTSTTYKNEKTKHGKPINTKDSYKLVTLNLVNDQQ